MNYYNEIDPFAAEWLRELIKAGHLPDGDVDTRSIEDVTANDLEGYTQCHFFAGIGGWSYALKLAEWPEDRPVWTGSCPCQPFSAAGARRGVDDERHLWPAFRWLIDQCRPATVFGEQVASKAGREWFTGVQTDLEAMGYDAAAADLCAASVGAPHIRQRLWWVADTRRACREWGAFAERFVSEETPKRGQSANHAQSCGALDGGMADTDVDGAERFAGDDEETPSVSEKECKPEHGADVSERGGEGVYGPGVSEAVRPRASDGGMAETDNTRSQGYGGFGRLNVSQGREDAGRHGAESGMVDEGWPRSVDNPWRDADWLFCRDGKWRRVEPGTFPLAHGVPARVGRLRGYGNAIVPQVAAEFILAADSQ